MWWSKMKIQNWREPENSGSNTRVMWDIYIAKLQLYQVKVAIYKALVMWRWIIIEKHRSSLMGRLLKYDEANIGGNMFHMV